MDAQLHNLSAPKMSRQSCHVTTQVNSLRGIPSIILAHQHVIVTDGLRICELQKFTSAAHTVHVRKTLPQIQRP